MKEFGIFKYLKRAYERTRRRHSGSLTSQTGLVFTPFLNPDYIRATSGYRRQGGAFWHLGEQLNPFHRHIIAINAPDWANVTYADVLERREKERRRQNKIVGLSEGDLAPSLDWRQSNGKDYYNFALHWKVVGKPIIDAALAQSGFLDRSLRAYPGRKGVAYRSGRTGYALFASASVTELGELQNR